MIANYNMVVDFARPSKSNTILVAENDANSRNCNFKLLFDKAPFDMTGVVSASVLGITASGARIYGDAEIKRDEEGNIINELSYLIPLSITENAGNVTMTVTLTDEVGARITSFEFYIKVRNALYDEDDFIDDDDMSGFRDLLARTRAALERMEQMVQEDALPNPYPIRITVDDVEYEYNGEDLVEIFMGKVAYYGEPSGLVEVTEDDSAAAVAVRAAEEAEGYAEDAEAKYNEMLDVYNDLQGIIPTARVERDSETHVARVIITDRSGETSVDLADGAPGPQGEPGSPGSKGDKGDTGATPSITASASVNNTTGTPSVTVTKSGTDENPTLAFAFENLKGEAGVPGPKGDKGDRGESGASEWGEITGSIEDQTDLANALASKADASDVSELVPESLLKDTVGWIGKNLLGAYYGKAWQYNTGILIDSDNAISSLKLPVSPDDKFIASKKSALANDQNMVVRLYDSNGVYSGSANILANSNLTAEYTVPSGVYYIGVTQFVSSGAGTKSTQDTNEIMLRKADISDSTYEPYHESVEEVVGDIRAEQAVLGAKNLLKTTAQSQSVAGGIWTVNADGTITASGTPTAWSGITIGFATIKNKKYILSGIENTTNVKWGFADLKDKNGNTLYTYPDIPTNPFVIDATSYPNVSTVDIQVKRQTNDIAISGTIYPMLRLASDPDDTYVPYVMTNKQLTDNKFDRAEQSVLGAKNLFGDITENPKAVNNATFTKSGNEYTISTAAQNNSGIYWQQGKLRDWFADKVGIRGILSFEIKGDGSFTAKVGEDSKNNRITCSTAYQKYEYVISDLSQIEAFVFYSQDVSNTHTLYVKNIMIRLASDPDDTYVPYAMTNREITDKLSVTKSEAVQVVEGATVVTNHLKRQGNVVCLDLRVNGLTASQDSIIFKIPNGFIPSEIIGIVAWIDGAKLISIDTNGNLICPSAVNNAALRLSGSWIIS